MARAQTRTVNKLDGSPARDLRVPGWLAKWPMIGVIMILVGSLIFGALAYNVQTHGPLLQWDVALANQLHAEAVKRLSGLLNS